MFYKRIKYITMFTGLFAVLISCGSSIEKADLPEASNPTEVVAKIENELNSSLETQSDVLAPEEYAESRNYLNKAKKQLANGEAQSDVLDNLRYSKAYAQKAKDFTSTRAPQIETILSARKRALVAGARNYPQTQNALSDIDRKIKKNSSSLNKIESQEISELQSKYSDLELSSLVLTQLGNAQSQINAAKDNKANKYTPQTLKTAEVNYDNAISMIRVNRNSPENYSAQVVKANASADILSRVLAATQNGKVNEITAAKVVMQDRKIKNLQTTLQETSGDLTDKNNKLSQANKMVSIQKAIDSARREFKKDEAEAFQQGDKLVLRLKTINFTSGRSELPADALTILAKVKSVAQELLPKEIVVEGHTDSVGSAQMNNALSQSRAEIIAKYFEENGLQAESVKAIGLGFSKPIANNKTSQGRSQNRRVDVVIAPSANN